LTLKAILVFLVNKFAANLKTASEILMQFYTVRLTLLLIIIIIIFFF